MLPFLCLTGSHAALPSSVWNQGLCFSTCRRCGEGMLRSDTTWKRVPKGFRIVWKRVARPGLAGKAGSGRGLPTVIAIGPEPVAAAKAPAPAKIQRDSSGFSFKELVSMGVQLLAWRGADGLRKWNSKRAARWAERRTKMLLLAA